MNATEAGKKVAELSKRYWFANERAAMDFEPSLLEAYRNGLDGAERGWLNEFNAAMAANGAEFMTIKQYREGVKNGTPREVVAEPVEKPAIEAGKPESGREVDIEQFLRDEGIFPSWDGKSGGMYTMGPDGVHKWTKEECEAADREFIRTYDAEAADRRVKTAIAAGIAARKIAGK